MKARHEVVSKPPAELDWADRWWAGTSSGEPLFSEGQRVASRRYFDEQLMRTMVACTLYRQLHRLSCTAHWATECH